MSRFDGSEKDFIDKATKLSGGNVKSRNIILKLARFINKSDTYLNISDEIGLYDQKIQMLYQACNYNIFMFEDVIFTLYHEDKNLYSLETQREFDFLVQHYSL